MGQHMDFAVATEDSNFMETNWIIAAGEKNSGIPRTFVVDAAGKLAWIGHPKDLDNVLPKIFNNTLDIKKELATRNLYRYLAALDDSAREVLNWLCRQSLYPRRISESLIQCL